MAVDPEGAEQVERENATAPLTELLQSTNEGVGKSRGYLRCTVHLPHKTSRLHRSCSDERVVFTNSTCSVQRV